jgi:hypothetical protein
MYCSVDDVLIDTLDTSGYASDKFKMFSIEHDTYVLSLSTTIESLTDVDTGSIEKVSHVNIISALNYSESIRLSVTDSLGLRQYVVVEIPELGDPADYDTADKARATAAVAEELARKINVLYTPSPWPPEVTESGLENISAAAIGSTVAIWEDGKANWIKVDIESGQGDGSAVAINQVVEGTEGFPKYAKVGTRVTIRPDPISSKGTYYLQAERIGDIVTGLELEEVVWAESRHPDQPHSLDNSTMPHVIKYDGTNFSFAQVPFKSRQAGDDDSAPIPDFVGQPLTTMGYFQKRLIVVAGNTVYMTETDDTLNWFKQSAVTLLVSDAVAVTTSELGSDKLLHLVSQNRDLLCISANAQFKISGAEAITPQTISMPLTTKYNCQTSVSPVTIGNTVFFPIDYGDSTGLQMYTGQKDTSQDFASPVTNHVVGYLKGTAELLAASPNLEMIAMTTTESADNVLYVYEQYTDANSKTAQRSWSEWVFLEDERIIDIKFRKNELVLVVAKGNSIRTKAIPMYTRITGSPTDVFLDDMLIRGVDFLSGGTTVTIPADYDIANSIVVRGVNAESELWEIGYQMKAGKILLDEPLAIDAQVYIGKLYTSLYEPSRPFKYAEDGSTITTDTLRIGKWIVSLVETPELTMLKTSKYSDDLTSKFEARFVGQYPLGSINAFTGDWKFPYSERADLATATFFTDSYLGCTIAALSWEGQYFQSKQRMK